MSAIERVVAGERVGFEAEGFVSVREAQPDPFHAGISEREREVLALVARGFTNREIATELYLSIDTVKTYMRRLFVKLDVSNRSQAAVLAVEQGVGSLR